MIRWKRFVLNYKEQTEFILLVNKNVPVCIVSIRNTDVKLIFLLEYKNHGQVKQNVQKISDLPFIFTILLKLNKK